MALSADDIDYFDRKRGYEPLISDADDDTESEVVFDNESVA